MSESDINFAVWEPEFIEQYGSGFIWISAAAAALVLILTLIAAFRAKSKSARKTEDVKL